MNRTIGLIALAAAFSLGANGAAVAQDKKEPAKKEAKAKKPHRPAPHRPMPHKKGDKKMEKKAETK